MRALRTPHPKIDASDAASAGHADVPLWRDAALAGDVTRARGYAIAAGTYEQVASRATSVEISGDGVGREDASEDVGTVLRCARP